MRRAVIDTNVVVSALIRPSGTPGRLLAPASTDRFRIVTSAALRAELLRVLARPRIQQRIHVSLQEKEDLLRRLDMAADEVEPRFELAVVRDPADNRLLEAAVAGQADYVVTGDQDLLVLGEYDGIRILTPAAFLLELGEAH